MNGNVYIFIALWFINFIAFTRKGNAVYLLMGVVSAFGVSINYIKD